MDLPPTIKIIGAVPHDWLLVHCSVVCHHGGKHKVTEGMTVLNLCN